MINITPIILTFRTIKTLPKGNKSPKLTIKNTAPNLKKFKLLFKMISKTSKVITLHFSLF
jgi:hypothetical protein